MWARADRRAAITGAIVLVVVAVVYPVVANDLGRPLAVFVLPALMTAVLGGWRPTVVVGVASLAVAMVEGLAGSLDTKALLARLFIIAVGVAMGAIGAAVRDKQAGRLEELGEALALREAFQRGLAPDPRAPAGVVVVVSYRPAERWLTVGGDFLEAVALSDGRLAVLVGDVCGHGPREAAFGAALRAGWKGIALSSEPDPQQWVEALDTAFFRDGRFDSFVTLCTGYLDPRTTDARLVNAGHVPPFLLGPEGAQPLELHVTKPLGIDRPATPVATDVTWVGDPVLFFTDGLIENPLKQGTPQRWHLDGLRAWLDENPSGDPHELVTNLDHAATANRELRDDVAILLVARGQALH
jgi:serine phosphatase RsbU (regulator of sigma subunit)